MAPNDTTILDLPNEILDRVFSYLAWSSADSLLPSYSDLESISLTCRVLRGAVAPTLFRNVRLKLRWIDGAIAEPGIYRLRREAPHIAKLVRCVHIQTVFEQDATSQLKPFTIAHALADWNDASHSDGGNLGNGLSHRDRIRQSASELYGSLSQDTSQHGLFDIAGVVFAMSELDDSNRNGQIEGDVSVDGQQATSGEQASLYPNSDVGTPATATPAEEPARTLRQNARRRRLQFDALMTCMASLPPQTQHIIFEAVPTDLQDQLQHTFALQVCATALRIFKGQLAELSIISRSLDALRPGNASGMHSDYNSTLGPAISGLEAMRTLTLAATAGHSDRLSRHSLDAVKASSWQVEPLCSNITTLFLRKITDKRSNIFDFVKSFGSLTDLTLAEVTMGPDFGRTGAAARRGNLRAPEDPMWLLFLISIRLHRPSLRLHLGKLLQWHAPNALPASAIQWLEEEAVPVGAKVDFERETRLTEDFGSFIGLWTVDDTERGVLARDDQGVGKLVDEAFSSRWRTFANQR